MKILLTGAKGLTGHFFSEAALKAGHELMPLQANLTDQGAVAAELTGAVFDAVVHLAAISFVGHAEDMAFYNVNVVGTTHLLSTIATMPQKLRCVLLASSANVYGNCEASPITEKQLPAPVNHYAMSKLAMEHMAWTYLDRLPIVVARPFNYTGPGQASQFIVPKLVNHFARRADRIELGNLQVEREFNDVRMVCDAYLKLLDKGVRGQTYNVCSGRTYALEQVIGTLEHLTGHHMDVQVNPAFVRANEVHRLCGSPDKLLGCTGALHDYRLEDTLRWMLAEVRS